MYRMALIAIAFALICAASVQAADRAGLYMAGSGGWTTVSDDLTLSDLEGDNTGPIPDQELDLDDGYAIIGAVGWDFGQFRLEGELGYRDNDVESISAGGFAAPGASGDFQAYSVMVNALVDAPLGDKFFIYGGIGGGTVVADLETDVGLVDTEIAVAALAYQVMAGVGVNVTDNVAITVGYRLFSAFDAEFENEDIDDGSNDELEGEMEFPVIHSVEVGFRYSF